jgi:hypothetical protein
MSLHTLAHHMASRGRGDDSMLVHMTPHEVAGLQALALKHGGSLSINPDTGLVEAGFLKNLLPMIAGLALGPAGFGLMSAGMAGLTVGAVTGLATGSLSKGLMAGLGAYGGAGLGEAFMGAGTGAGLGESLAGASYGDTAQAFGDVAAAEGSAGQAFNEYLKSGANPATMSGADKLAAGFKSVADDPLSFAKDNWKYAAAALSPVIADEMVPTTTGMPAPSHPGYIRPYQFDAGTRQFKAAAPVAANEWGTREFPDYIPAGRYANGGVVGYADGGDTGLTDQSQNAYSYLMGDTSTTERAALPTQSYVPTLMPASTAAPAAALPMQNSGGDGASSNPSAWSNMTPGEQASFYAANPTMSAITQAGQQGLGLTALGALSQYADPVSWGEQSMIARGVDPATMGQLNAAAEQRR